MGSEVPVVADPSKAPPGARWVDPNVKAAQRGLEEISGDAGADSGPGGDEGGF